MEASDPKPCKRTGEVCEVSGEGKRGTSFHSLAGPAGNYYWANYNDLYPPVGHPKMLVKSKGIPTKCPKHSGLGITPPKINMEPGNDGFR